MLYVKKLTGITIALMMLAPTFGFSETTKIDPMLSIMTHEGANLTMMESQRIARSVQGVAEPLVGTIIRFQGDLSGVEAIGGKIRSIIGDIATIDIPLSAVNHIAQLPNIIYIEAAKSVQHELDVSVPDTGANLLRSGIAPNWTGNTGKGVIIGIVDGGIDLNHADFKDASSKTRLLYLWDQAATTGTTPSGFNYGNECTKAIIDAGGCTATTVTDTDGHGTHVAGIAAGNGAATGNGYAPYYYVGMAPEADLIIVNSLNNGVTASNAVLDGIAYIQAKAKALGKPAVINLSLGDHHGPHDGTSNYEKGIDNASGAGKVIVKSAGNDGAEPIHASDIGSGNVTQGGSTTVSFTLPSGTTYEKLDIWYAGADQMGIIVSNGICMSGVVNPGTTQSFDTGCGKIDVASSDVNPNNGDREILVYFSNGTYSLASGTWSITLSGISISSGTFDVWATQKKAQFTNPVYTRTISIPGAATKAITVAAYNTSKTSLGTAPFPGTNGDIASFSSKGPKRSCSDTSKCPFIWKPEIAAHGNRIMSSFSAQTASFYSADLDVDGVHILMQGTSMAAPHVTGAVALLLQTAPTLTSDQIKSILTSNTTVDSFVTALFAPPNLQWGYGKLNVNAAYAATPTNLPPAVPTDVMTTAGNGQATISWSPALGAVSYNIYWSTTTGVTKTNGTKIANVTNPYVHTGLTNGTVSYYVVTAVNTNGETAESTQVSATPIAPGSGGSGGGGSSGGGGGGGCFIATAAYGSYLDPHVQVLREFRDAHLITNTPGRAFISFYYNVSPPIADFISEHETLKITIRLALTPIIYSVKYPLSMLLFTGCCVGIIVYRKRRNYNDRRRI